MYLKKKSLVTFDLFSMSLVDYINFFQKQTN